MKDKLSIQTEIDYLKWITKKRKTIRRVLVKNKIQQMFQFVSKPEASNIIFNFKTDYWL